jgi:hypothetical protein
MFPTHCDAKSVSESTYLFKHAQGSTTRVIQSTIDSSLSLPIHFTDSVYELMGKRQEKPAPFRV